MGMRCCRYLQDALVANFWLGGRLGARAGKRLERVENRTLVCSREAAVLMNYTRMPDGHRLMRGRGIAMTEASRRQSAGRTLACGQLLLRYYRLIFGDQVPQYRRFPASGRRS